MDEYRNTFDSRKAENYGFASMAAVQYAHIVGNMLRKKPVKGTTITLAPNPKDIVRAADRCSSGIASSRLDITDLGEFEQDS